MCYIKFDKELLKTGLSPRAMILYALISDRLSLSKQNNWRDSFGGVYCYYTMEAIAEEMCIDKRQARRLIAELEAAELIIRQRQNGSRTKPFKIYAKEGTKMSFHEGTKMSSHEGTKMSSHEGTKMSPESEQDKSTNINPSSSSSVDELISSAEAQTGKSLSEEGRKKIKQAVAEHKSTIGNLPAYIRKCVTNAAMLETLEEEPAGYALTYDIAEYERTSISDFDYWRDNEDDEEQEKGGK